MNGKKQPWKSALTKFPGLISMNYKVIRKTFL